jgi:hypothetical protein
MRWKFHQSPPYLLPDPIRINHVRFNHTDNGRGALCACPGHKTDQARTPQYATHQLNSTISLVAELVAEKFAKKLLGESEIEAVLQRLDRLTLDEARLTGAQTLQVIHDLVNNMKVVMDGMQAISGCRQLLIRLVCADSKASTSVIRQALSMSSLWPALLMLIGNASYYARDDV